MVKKETIALSVATALLIVMIAVGAKAGNVYDYRDIKLIQRTFGIGGLHRIVDSENGVVCYVAEDGGLGIGLSCLQTR